MQEDGSWVFLEVGLMVVSYCGYSVLQERLWTFASGRHSNGLLLFDIGRGVERRMEPFSVVVVP
jgi:hypothetical protein